MGTHMFFCFIKLMARDLRMVLRGFFLSCPINRAQRVARRLEGTWARIGMSWASIFLIFSSIPSTRVPMRADASFSDGGGGASTAGSFLPQPNSRLMVRCKVVWLNGEDS